MATLSYLNEFLIQRFLSSSVPEGLVKVQGRLRKTVDPILKKFLDSGFHRGDVFMAISSTL
jgi:hypothetical protein